MNNVKVRRTLVAPKKRAHRRRTETLRNDIDEKGDVSSAGA